MGGIEDSSLTRVQPVFETALARDATGASWLSLLLAVAPEGRVALGALVDTPGRLIPATVEPSSSRKASLRCFEQQVPPDRRLLSWCIEHPERLTAPSVSNPATESDRRRLSLICDEPPGSRAVVQQQAREHVARAAVGQSAWWRFERSTEIDCVLATDRLVLCIEGKRKERLSRDTTWLEGRHQVARNLEAACRLAGSRRAFAVLVCVENEGDPTADLEFVRRSLGRASPHLFDAEREALANAYLGELRWDLVCKALRLDAARLPRTVGDLPARL